jgi:fused signal recognition particle receptor
VLIDTAGRMQNAKNLMYEIGKIVKVIKPDVKLFVGDSLSGNDTINQAREFFSYTEFDGAILTKSDADAKGGAAISISYITSKPIIYLGMGQGYDDLVLFNKEKFVNTVFGNESLSISDEMSLPSYYGVKPSSIQPDSTEEIQTIKSFSKFNVDIGPNDSQNRLDPITSNGVLKNEKESTIEVTDLTPEIVSQREFKENDNAYSDLDIDHMDTSMPEGNNGNTGNYDKLKTEEDPKPNVESKSDSKEKKGLFGWFKKKKP